MNFTDALERTDTRRGPSSNLAKLLSKLDDADRREIEDALQSDVSLYHLQRALTLLAKHHGVIAGEETITVESIKKRREADQ